MRIDRSTLTFGLMGVVSAAVAVWLWVMPAPAAPSISVSSANAHPPEPAVLGPVLARLTPVERADQIPPPAAFQRALRLIGIVEADDGRVAVIVVDGETVFLRPGETAAGVELLALDPSLAVVVESGQSRRLILGGR